MDVGTALVRYLLTEGDISAGNELWQQAQLKPWLIVCYFVLMWLCLSAIVSYLTDAKVWATGLYAGLFVAAWCKGSQWLSRMASRRNAIRYFRLAPSTARSEISLKWTEEYVSFSQENAYQKLHWREIREWIEDENVLVILHEGPLFHPIPKRALSINSLEKIRAHLGVFAKKKQTPRWLRPFGVGAARPITLDKTIED